MTKDDTRQLKGLAILMMLWLHLFSDEDTVRGLHYCLPYLNGLPLVYSLTRIASCCVPIYLFLGGYGLASVFQSAGQQLQGGRRALSLMVNFWLIFIVFVPLGIWYNPERYPGDVPTFVLNALAIRYSYNGAWWFLLPYVLLTLAARPIISRCMDSDKRLNTLWLVMMALLYVGIYLLESNTSVSDVWPFPGLMTILNVLSMLFLFGVGVMAVKYRWIVRLHERLSQRPQWELALELLLLCMVKMAIGRSSLLNVPFILLFIPLLLALHWPRWLHRALQFLGYHSCNMWLIHFFFSFIFGDLIYGLRYPLVIFLCLTLASLVCSMLLQPIVEPIKHRIKNAAHR